jgi:hypothetical protein
MPPATRQSLRHLEQNKLEPFRVDQVGLGHHRDADRHAEVLQHGEVLGRSGA